MAKNTSYFDGKKLTEGREARGFTVTDLAKRLSDDQKEVSKQSISFYEKGKQLPTFRMVEKMSEVLRLPLQFFIPEKEIEEVDNSQRRSRHSATEIATGRARQKLKWLIRIVQYLKTWLNFPLTSVPYLPPDISALSLTDTDVAGLANDVREAWSLGDKPIGNITKLLEQRGVIIGYVDFKDSSVEAITRWSELDETPYILLNACMGTPARKRLTLAYELGRLVMHRYVPPEQIDVPEYYKRFEEQAYYFGSNFLMPAKSFGHEFYMPTLDVLLSRKEKWGVSVGAMIKRCGDLGIVSKSQLTGLWINYGRRGWKHEEPFENRVTFTEPTVVKSGVNELIVNEYVSSEDFKANIPYDLSDVEELCSLSPNSLVGKFTPPIKPTLKEGTGTTIIYHNGTPVIGTNSKEIEKGRRKTRTPPKDVMQGDLADTQRDIS